MSRNEKIIIALAIIGVALWTVMCFWSTYAGWFISQLSCWACYVIVIAMVVLAYFDRRPKK